jgi:hypothetical protein
MTTRHRSPNRAARRYAASARPVTRGQTSALAPSVVSAVEGVIEQLRKEGERSRALEIVVRVRHEGPVVPVVSAADLEAQAAAITSAGFTVAAPMPAVPAADADLLATRPVVAPAPLLQKLPFRRHIEGSRPYLVLGEGVRMINAHPMAVMVFWGGFTDWAVGYILAGHAVANAVRLAVLGSLMALWLATCLVRTGTLAELRDSVRAMRVLLADPATWARIQLSDRAGWGMLPLARIASTLLIVRGPDPALIRAAVTAQRDAGVVMVNTSEEQVTVLESGCTR